MHLLKCLLSQICNTTDSNDQLISSARSLISILFISIRCVAIGRDGKHAGRQPSRAVVWHLCHRPNTWGWSQVGQVQCELGIVANRSLLKRCGMSAMASKMSGFGWQEVLNAETAQLDGSWLKSDGVSPPCQRRAVSQVTSVGWRKAGENQISRKWRLTTTWGRRIQQTKKVCKNAFSQFSRLGSYKLDIERR